jgi:hypothetical protein
VRSGRRGSVLLLVVVSVLAAAACSSDDADPAARDDSADEHASRERSSGSTEGERGAGPAGSDRPATRSSSPPLRRAKCPAGAGNCRSASGRVLYVERVDPDGDGDAHFVLASSQSVTAPGISVIDVKRSLRPSPLPGRGDRLSAAGPVFRGSFGQRQIEAVELHVARAR